ncbi:hypothetical protein EC912_104296 [Luteibacter rhizovicinus]|uniref:DUF535 domain-containing protein n=1 Tax=Luteibacter rhizovicinus TaxID=242606 RepID=A0A4V2W406_9GAMM|nr:DUF535 family protein [Luteibacter rhizovicinus]TCV94099.1 hypothetical protein EC912_104296 [Luteibacter rhizovicinus]
MKALSTWNDGDNGAGAHAAVPMARDGYRLMAAACRDHWNLRSASTARRVAGLAKYTLRSMLMLRRQTDWLRFLHGNDAMRQAVRTDPRLYARWHSHYISARFSREARHRMVDAHYRFLLQRFPKKLREKLLRGHGARMATLVLDQGALAHLYLRQSTTGTAGELDLFVVNSDKEVLSSCTITFAGHEGILVGAMHGSWAYMGAGPVRRFIQGSNGLGPRNLLLSLVRSLAAMYGFRRIRAVSHAALPVTQRTRTTEDSYDRFWIEHGGLLGNDGCYELPCAEPVEDPGVANGKRSAARRRREQFREDACELLLRALRWDAQKS